MPPRCGDGACWCRPTKLYSPEGAAELVEHFGAARVPDAMPHPLCGRSIVVRVDDRRKRHDVPILPRQHMAGRMVPRVTPVGRVSPAAERRFRTLPPSPWTGKVRSSAVARYRRPRRRRMPLPVVAQIRSVVITAASRYLAPAHDACGRAYTHHTGWGPARFSLRAFGIPPIEAARRRGKYRLEDMRSTARNRRTL